MSRLLPRRLLCFVLSFLSFPLLLGCDSEEALKSEQDRQEAQDPQRDEETGPLTVKQLCQNMAAHAAENDWDPKGFQNLSGCESMHGKNMQQYRERCGEEESLVVLQAIDACRREHAKQSGFLQCYDDLHEGTIDTLCPPQSSDVPVTEEAKSPRGEAEVREGAEAEKTPN